MNRSVVTVRVQHAGVAEAAGRQAAEDEGGL